MKKDYYKILGVEKTSTQEQISAAYRELARKWHPDMNPDSQAEATEKFKEINEAFEVLGNPEKRQRYDNPTPTGFQHVGGRSPFDIFNSFFGGGFRKQGVDIEQIVELDFEEAALGCIKEVQLHLKERCGACNGTGAESWKSCIACAGTGRQIIRQDPFVLQQTCYACQGQGKLADKKCDKCKDGVASIKEETVAVNIPAGAFNGLRMKAAGKGELDENGYRGDLYFALRVREHALFTRQGCDIICEVPIAYATMVLGGEVVVPTLHGTANLKVKPGTQNGKKMRLSGMGVPDVTNPSVVGDMYVVLKIDVPTQINAEYKELLRRLQELEQKHISPRIKEFSKYK